MLKRTLALLIAGGLFSAQIGLAVADQGAFPSNDTEVIWKPLPAQLKYFEQRAASVQADGVVLRGDSFPQSDELIGQRPLPSQAKYFAQREAEIAKEASRYAYPTIRIHPGTENVTVEHLGAVRFVDDNGHAFVWRADTLGETAVPVKSVAPADFNAGSAMIYVRHPSSHIPG